jgi:hypothetical protein
MNALYFAQMNRPERAKRLDYLEGRGRYYTDFFFYEKYMVPKLSEIRGIRITAMGMGQLRAAVRKIYGWA